MKTSQSPSDDVPSKQDKPASNLPIKQPAALQPGEKPKHGPKAATPLKKRSKKRPEKRPFGSIRCRSVRFLTLHQILGFKKERKKMKIYCEKY